MPRFSLNLDKIRISCQEKKLELVVESASFFKCPDGKFQHWEKPELLEHLSSGKVWVSRGNNYRLDFQILINDRKCSQNVIDRLGNHVRNLPVGLLAVLFSYGDNTKYLVAVVSSLNGAQA
jgi:hypothetical protein